MTIPLNHISRRMKQIAGGFSLELQIRIENNRARFTLPCVEDSTIGGCSTTEFIAHNLVQLRLFII